MRHTFQALLAVACALCVSWPVPSGAEPVTVIRRSGVPSNRVDITVVGDGYTTADMTQYAADTETFVSRLFEQEPFRTYEQYFNIHRIDVVSAETGVDHPASGIYRTTALEAFYDCAGIERLICIDHTRLEDVLTRSVDSARRDIVIVLVNDTTYGGSGGAVAVSSTHSSGLEIVLHELGHSFGLLADEYDYGPPSCDTGYEPLEPNITTQSDRAAVKWLHWIDPTTPVPTTTPDVGVGGLFEGAKYCATGMYRPTLDSKMRSLYQPFDSINTEQLTMRIYNVVTPIDESWPASSDIVTHGAVASFGVRVLRPSSHSLAISWRIDGQEVATSESIAVNPLHLTDGAHRISVTVADPTPQVRDDPSQVLVESRTWVLRVDRPAERTSPTVSLVQPGAGVTLTGVFTVTAAASDVRGVARVDLWLDASLAASTSTLPYSFTINTTAIANGNHTLEARAYSADGNVGSSGTRTIKVSNGGPLPAGWRSQDIGRVGSAGAASASDGTFTVTGAGADVWGVTDAFHYVYQPMTGDGTIVARVASMAGAQAWTKVGVMVRASTSRGAAHAFMLVSGQRGLAFQRRRAQGLVSAHTSGGPGSAPQWLKLERRGSVITAAVSRDGATWTTVGRDTFTMPPTVLVGVVVHGHDPSSPASATFDGVRVTPLLPAPWRSADVGRVGVPGMASGDGRTFTMQGSGADVWGSADGFHYVYRTLTGDGSIVARVASITGSQPWTKMGVMVRASQRASAAHAFMLVSAGRGLAFQRRTADGLLSTHTSGGAGAPPRWVRLRRRGARITASVSVDGRAWTIVGSDTFVMPATVAIGLAAHGHDRKTVALATFDHVSITGRR